MIGSPSLVHVLGLSAGQIGVQGGVLAIVCDNRFRDLATDEAKRAMFDRLASQYSGRRSSSGASRARSGPSCRRRRGHLLICFRLGMRQLAGRAEHRVSEQDRSLTLSRAERRYRELVWRRREPIWHLRRPQRIDLHGVHARIPRHPWHRLEMGNRRERDLLFEGVGRSRFARHTIHSPDR